jgi:hypothetical protein
MPVLCPLSETAVLQSKVRPRFVHRDGRIERLDRGGVVVHPDGDVQDPVGHGGSGGEAEVTGDV